MSKRTVLLSLAIAAYAAFLIAAYAVAFCAPAVGIFHDDGVYLVTAKALAEGKGYRILSLPDEPDQTKYPILFPALLALVWKLYPAFPENAPLLKLIPLLSTILWCLLTFKLLAKRHVERRCAAAISLLTAGSYSVLFLSTTLLSESLFACLCTATLLWIARLEEPSPRRTWPDSLLAATLAAAAFHTRTLGITLVLGSTAGLMLRRRFWPAAQFFFSAVVLISPWIWWQASHLSVAGASQGYYSQANYHDWNILTGMPHLSILRRVSVVGQNVWMAALSVCVLLGFLGWGAPGLILALLVAIFAVRGLWRDLAEGVGPMHLFVLLYMLVVFCWVWPPARFLVVILPLVLVLAYRGLPATSRPRRSAAIRLLAVALPGAGVALALATSIPATLSRGAPGVASLPQIDWRQMEELFRWVRENAEPEAVLMANLDPTCYLYTGRKTVRGFVADPFLLHYSSRTDAALGSSDDLMRTVVRAKVRYIIRTPPAYFGEVPIWNRLLAELEDAGAIRVVTQGASADYRVYQVQVRKRAALATVTVSVPAAGGLRQ